MSAERAMVLLAGKVHPRVRERVEAEFDAVSIEAADAGLLSDETRNRVRGMASGTRISADFIDSLPNLEVIANFGVGYDAVDGHQHAGCALR